MATGTVRRRTREWPPSPRSAPPTTRITNQFCTREGSVYELAHDQVRLRITMRENRDGLGSWTAEAHVHAPTDRRSIAKPGATRERALRAVARAWRAKHHARGFPEMDWDAVATAMRAVRAL